MCQFCSESNEQMEPNDNKLTGPDAEEQVGSSTSPAENPEQVNEQKDALSPVEAAFPSLTVSLTRSSESFASNSSELSVEVNPYDDGHSREDPRYRLYNEPINDSNKQGKNESILRNLESDSQFAKKEESTSSDESSDETDDPSPTLYEQDKIWDPPEAEENSMTTLDDYEYDESADADSSEWAMPRLKEKDMARENVRIGKFKDLVSQLLSKLGLENCDETKEKWADIVTDLAWQAAKFVEPGVIEGKAMDPSGYVKIKCIASGSRGESRLIKGLVFKKHAAHKHMITKYTNARLLLIQGMLGSSSGSSGLSSFNSMISEDKVNWDDLMQNLQACQPNVILVEKSASRAVMEKILQMGVTLVLDMKLNRLERVARCTGSPILSCDVTFSQELRHCESLYFEKFVEEHTVVPEGGKKPSKTLMFLEGCPTRLGCTALKCEACEQPPEAHFYYYAHHSKQLTIRVKRLGNKKPLPGEGKLWMWSRCSKCEPNEEKATKRVLLSTAADALSFGKFLELSFSSYSSFNRLASCGHSFQKDFLYFFGLGSMVAMFQYSRVAIYGVSVPSQKLKFNSSIDRDWLQPEVRTVYTTGLVLFNELEKYLKKIESRFSGWNLVLNGFSKGFADIVDMLKLERSEFEENFKNKNEDSQDTIYKLLSLNRLRWEILLEACVWDRRLQSLLSSSSTLPQSVATGVHGVAQGQKKDDGTPGEEAEGLKTAPERVEKQILLEEEISGRESEVAQNIADKALQEQVDSGKEHSDGAVADTTKIVERLTGSLNNEGVEIQRAEDNCHDVIIEGKEVILQGDDRTSENCNDVEIQIEMLAEAENLSVKESPKEGILLGNGEQDLISLPIVEENTQRLLSFDSVSSVSLSQESNDRANNPSHLHINGESTQEDNVSLSDNLSEDRSVSINADEENSSCSADAEVSERLASALLKVDSPWWHPFRQTREECMEELLKGRPSRFGHLPKFELLHSTDFLPTVSQVIIEEGSRIHMPLSDGDFIVSDFDGEISSSIACALALMEISIRPASDENTFLKRAASEPWPLNSIHDSDFIHSSSSMSFTESHLSSFTGLNRVDSLVSYGRVYNEVTLGIEKYPMKGKYSVVIIHPNEFRSLRDRCCPSELDYISSLSRCKIWDAKGGKSKSVFARSLDGRLIVKEIKKTEFDSFMKFASAYFQHMKESVNSGNQTCLAKILGIYQVTIRNPKSGKETKHDLMVQENLSFGRNITRQYDLKGALHARFTASADGDGEVLLDQNFVNDMNSSPLYVGQKAKRLLQRAVWNDTTFLNNIGVMDYSLLVGVDRKRHELVCGIIDYLRQYTWDKQFETWVKSSLVVPKNVSPTIISPHEYKKRFRKFMDTHFLTVPDHWCSHRSFNPCKLCGVKVHDSSVLKSEKREEEPNDVQSHD
ncbi:putative 1-phosphatidylinositol-3-phosphate 5-kinase FAB1D isoform X2 [Beta vulgaris subsp. vulgaris]|uniref:putative 1-phosphatidylinositol-3-phosphate 5-kinase FAB1D isoform X2 n=1 Tax=Beta vulgaris subsp. vulgaris TaxID=3555 RepID=UPI0020371524|nr:putative 1-phosphatidylinositol-3-phosphate 5-kinase FAB1D isoform X2 [Beta vulgaris subsp. vulgaris]